MSVGGFVAVALLAAACSSPQGAGPPGSTTTVAPGPTTVPLPGRCDVSQTTTGPHVVEHPVTIRGVRYYRFVNEASTPCQIEDAPVLRMIDAAGKALFTSTYIPPGGAGPSAPRELITLAPGKAEYLNLSDLTRAGFGARPPKVVCPTSSALEMTFPGSPGTITVTGAAGRFAPYEQLGGTKVGCGMIIVLPLSTTPSDAIPV